MNTALKLDEPTPLSEVAAANIRAFAGLRGFNQMDFVRIMGMSQGVVNKRWRGVIPWTVDELGIVAHILDVEVFDLIRPIEAAGAYAKPRRGLTPAGSAARSKGLEPPTFWSVTGTPVTCTNRDSVVINFTEYKARRLRSNSSFKGLLSAI